MDKNCAQCGKLFVAKSTRARFCGQNCQMTAWRHKNAEHNAAYQRAWQQRHPEVLAAYNARRRKGWAKVPCLHCGTVYKKGSSQSRYCSTSCRGKARYARPGEKEKSIEGSRRWKAKNKTRSNAYHRKYYSIYSQRKMLTQPWLPLLIGAKRRAKIKGVAFDLDAAWASARWTGFCEVTGIAFTKPAERIGRKKKNKSPSIDRVVAGGPYTKNNCRFVLRAVNSLKMDSHDALMLQIARAIVAREAIMPSHQIAIEGLLALPG